MKKFFTYLLCVALTAGLTACSHHETPQADPVRINTSFLDGTWSLTEISGAPLAEGTYLYLCLDRRELTFTLYHNLESMYAHRTTGTWSLTDDPGQGMLLTGEYDYQLGSWATWRVTAPDERTLHLARQDRSDEVRVYTRCENVPEEVVNGSRGGK